MGGKLPLSALAGGSIYEAMDAAQRDPATRPFIRVAVGLGVVVIAILGTILALYHAPPAPSPYGCYRGAGSPLVRLLPGRLIVEGARYRQQSVTVTPANIGYVVQPGFAFAAGDNGSLAPVNTNLNVVVVYREPREVPFLLVPAGERDVISLVWVACPPTTK